MSDCNLSDEHFGRRKPNTGIKHEIYRQTLTASLSIAHVLATKNDEYSIVDLFAGRGAFDDGTLGSPLIALDIAADFIKSNENVKYQKLNFVFVEKASENAAALKSAVLKHCIQEFPIANISTPEGNWEDSSNDLRTVLEKSKYGFIFADPYSTQLEIERLAELLSRRSDRKDILIFVNFSAVNRLQARGLSSDMEKVRKTLGDQANNLDGSFNEAFMGAVRKFGSKFQKSFVLSVAIPQTREGNLTNSDYYYLTLCTGSTGVADSFLSGYSKLHEGRESREDLFTESWFNGAIVKSIESHGGSAGLFSVIIELYNDYFSWKNYGEKRIPTVRNICEALNNMATDGSIVIEAPAELRHKAKDTNHKLKQEAFKTHSNIRKVTLRRRQA